MSYVQVACHWLMKRLNRRSVIIISMALLMLVSMVIIYYEAILSTVNAIRDHTLLRFGRICVGARPLNFSHAHPLNFCVQPFGGALLVGSCTGTRKTVILLPKLDRERPCS